MLEALNDFSTMFFKERAKGNNVKENTFVFRWTSVTKVGAWLCHDKDETFEMQFHFKMDLLGHASYIIYAKLNILFIEYIVGE
jgi:hypothetical protein